MRKLFKNSRYRKGMRWKNLVVIGTSHIAAESKKEVRQVILKEEPDIIALELDKKRLYALLHPKQEKLRLRDIKKVGFKGWLFGVVGAWAEKKLGEQAGGKPGQEMLEAISIARDKRITLALIDQDIQITLQKFSKSLSWKEKGHFIGDLFNGIVLRKQEIQFDLRKVPSSKIISQLTSKVKKRYPNIYRVLVTERNEIMARRLAHIIEMHPSYKIVAIIGAGHEKEIIRLIKKYYKGNYL